MRETFLQVTARASPTPGSATATTVGFVACRLLESAAVRRAITIVTRHLKHQLTSIYAFFGSSDTHIPIAEEHREYLKSLKQRLLLGNSLIPHFVYNSTNDGGFVGIHKVSDSLYFRW